MAFAVHRVLPPALAMTLALAATLRPAAARAHFILDEPACFSEQDNLGMPQKSAPCGQADPAYPLAPTGAVTAVLEGDTVTISFTETIFHAGHYRIALAATMDELPADPPVTADTNSACGSTVIDSQPALPVLADGVLVHTAPFSGPQTVQVQLPAGLTCSSCVLQVTEFMSNHPLNNPGGCFYHHCAMLTVSARSDGGTGMNDAGAGVDSGTASDAGIPRSDAAADANHPLDASGSNDAGTGGHMAGGCHCQTAGSSGVGWGGIAIVALAVSGSLRRRRRAG